ncbi:DUF6510 family protein [Microbacterium sp. JZ31]|uniref:DUF6510 family protein n=1 Tax=Microbacterium sp. JZ31 TaxID=1906274 RepID=UPI001931C9D9|nr:DUF6510 family protein [Microbacterium sp. JZ31]
MTHLDGNALAGRFDDLLGIDLTAAVGRCGGCGQARELARARAFVTAMGTVLRCAECESVLAVLVDARDEVVVNLSGLAFFTVPAH